MAKEEEIVELEEQGPRHDGMVTSVVIMTTLILLAAFIVVEMALKEYGRGIFFK